MHKKLGPLELWQWAAIGGVAGLVFLLWRRHAAAAAAAPGTQPYDQASQDQLGPIDPTTGQPYALEAAGAQGKSLGNELQDLGAIEALQAGSPGFGSGAGGANSLTTSLEDLASIVGLMQAMQTSGLVPGPASNTNPAPVSSPAPYGGHTGKIVGPGKGYIQIGPNMYIGYGGAIKTAKQAGIANPGHSVSRGSGGHSASSSSPHNPRQHHNAAPPSHQRAPRRHTTRHPRKPPRRGGGNLGAVFSSEG